MAKHRYVSNILFDDEDDNDDYKEDHTIPTTGFRVRNTPPQPKPSEQQQQKQDTQMKIREIENRTLMSASNSLALLQDANDAGTQAAAALDLQGEKLQKTNSNLDGIITNLNISQKHINGIKSVFSGFKNYILGKSDSPSPRKEDMTKNLNTSLSISRSGNTIDNSSQRTSKIDNFKSHPATHLHGLNEQPLTGPVSSSQLVTDILNENLNEMSHHVNNLKELGLVLGKKIDEQNELIDKIQDKTEVADIKIGKQNKEMNKILGK